MDQGQPKAHRRGPIWAHVSALLFIVLVGLWLIGRADEPLRPGGVGDPYSDANVLIAGKQFAENGFVAYHFLPNYVPGAHAEPPDFYTHYPPLPEIANGLLRRIGIESVAGFRACAIAVSCLALALWYILICYLVGTGPALLSLIFLGSRPIFLRYADSLHQFSYAWFTCCSFIGKFWFV